MGFPDPHDRWEPDEESICRMQLQLMHQPVKVGEQVVGRVTQAIVKRREDGWPDTTLEVEMDCEAGPLIGRSRFHIATFEPTIRRTTS